MNWSIAFEPLLPWPWLAAVLLPVALLALTGLWLRQRGALLRFAALLALAGALVNPVFLDEEREPMKSVVALIVDRSQSQDIGARTSQTDQAVAGMQERLARFKQFEVRVVEAGKASAADDRTETRLFGALDSAFRDVPASRVGGAVMITDGQVHDVPKTAEAIGAPLHALITGDENEMDRRIRFENAPRFGIVGKPIDMTYRVIATGGQRGMVDVRVSVNGQQIARRTSRDRPRDAASAHHPQCRPQYRRTRHQPGRGRTDRHQQPRHRHAGRHPRKSSRAAGFRRTACRRAHLAQPPEVRRLRRPRSLHHPAPAGKAGWHADQRTVADRLPDARAVCREDQRFRPDHLRPLPAPRRAADPLLRLYRRICGKWRRAADRRGSGICRRCIDFTHTSDVGATGAADRRGAGRSLLSAPHRVGQTPSGDTRPRRLRLGAAALEPLVPHDRHRAAGRRSP